MEELDTKKLDQIFRQQVHLCQELMKLGKTPDEFVLKSLRTSRAAVSLLQQYVGGDEDTNETDQLKLALHNYTQSVLDSTYFQECKLISAEFSDKTSFGQIAAINRALSLPAQLCGSVAQLCGSVAQVAEVLGTELLECLYWRVGALLYMFCHSMYKGGEEKKREVDRDVFLKCCCAGVGHLRLMLSARTPLAEDDDYISHDADMIQLLQQGIFSDIHMLSLMYAGELCYWAWSVSSEYSPSADQVKNEQATKMSRVNNSRTATSKRRTKDASVAMQVDGMPAETDAAAEVGDKSPAADCGPTGTNDGKLTEVIHRLAAIETYHDSSRVCSNPGKEGGDGACEAGSVCIGTSIGNKVGDTSGGSMVDAGASSAPGGVEGVAKEDVSLYNVMLHTQGLPLVDAWKSDFNSLRHGVEMLSKYISVARGPLKEHGWNYSKAVELMVKLKKAACAK